MTMTNCSIQDARDLVSTINDISIFLLSGACADMPDVREKLLESQSAKLEQLDMLLLVSSEQQLTSVPKEAS